MHFPAVSRSVLVVAAMAAGSTAIAPVVAAGATTTTKAAPAISPEVAAGMFAGMDGVADMTPYLTALRALTPHCVETSPQLISALTGVVVVHQKNTGRTVKVRTVLADLATALKKTSGKQHCIDDLVTIELRYDKEKVKTA